MGLASKAVDLRKAHHGGGPDALPLSLAGDAEEVKQGTHLLGGGAGGGDMSQVD